MTEITLTKTRVLEGIWQGILTAPAKEGWQPELKVTHHGKSVPHVKITPTEAAKGPGAWIVQVPIPAALIADGVQTFVIAEAETGEVLSSFAILAGDALAEDIRAEIDMLRAELDLLKRAFRRHCVETM
jgi:hypothetical protein